MLAARGFGSTKQVGWDSGQLAPVFDGLASKPTQQWKRKLHLVRPSIDPGFCLSCPPPVAMVGDHLLFVDTKRDLVHDVSVRSGKARWTFQAEKGSAPNVGFTHHAVTVTQFHSLGEQDRSEGDLSYTTGLDPETGRPIWRVSGDLYAVPGGEVVIHGVGKLRATSGRTVPGSPAKEVVSLPSGKRLLTLPRGARVRVGYRNLYVWTGHQYEAHSLQTGRRLWQTDLAATLTRGRTGYEKDPTEFGSIVVVDAGGDRWFAYDIETGKRLWGPFVRHNTGGLGAWPRDNMVSWTLVDDHCLLVDATTDWGSGEPGRRVFWCIEPRSGRTRWRRVFTDWSFDGAMVDGGLLFTDDFDDGGSAKLIDPSSGRTIRSLALPGGAYGAQLGQHRTFALDHGRVAARDLSTGRVVWTLGTGRYSTMAMSDDAMVLWSDDEIAVYR